MKLIYAGGNVSFDSSTIVVKANTCFPAPVSYDNKVPPQPNQRLGMGRLGHACLSNIARNQAGCFSSNFSVSTRAEMSTPATKDQKGALIPRSVTLDMATASATNAPV